MRVLPGIVHTAVASHRNTRSPVRRAIAYGFTARSSPVSSLMAEAFQNAGRGEMLRRFAGVPGRVSLCF
ncbi:hypothetical protein, partial [Streptomyces sp. bgisy082]|uniref:hypothetical protein n=1 Tax=Streptomyces sp. bgisy082 TaxID=3413776 RepID=UPI003D732D4E